MASFDVFDTLLVRRVGAPEAVFDVLAQRLELPVAPDVFASARHRAEVRLEGLLGRHPTLAEVYAEVSDALLLPAERVAELVQAEEALDLELVTPLPGADALVEAARAAYDRVLFLSDTPHSEDFVRTLLTRAGLARTEDLVRTSAGCPHSKSRGGLFTAVAQELWPATFTHLGDNRRSDVAAARAEGWAASWAPLGRLTRYEQILERHADASASTTSWLAGAARLARAESARDGVLTPIAEVASGVLGPILVGYALWVAGEARRRGIKRLYYVARDGHVMLQAARPVLARLAPELELRYLHGSRQPWIFGASATDEVALQRWVTPRRDFTARTTLSRVGLAVEEAHALSGHPLTDPRRADVALSADERTQLAELIRSAPLDEVVRRNADLTAQQTLAYLAQEGILDGVPYALVDAGWEGRTAAAFDQLVRRGGGTQAEHFVIGMLPSAADPREESGVRMTPWLFDRQRHPRDWADFQAPNLLIEMMCAGTTGRTLGYKVGDDGVRPVLAAPDNDPVLQWGLPEMQAVAVRTAELAAAYLPSGSAHVDLRPAVAEVMRAFWLHPTDAEAHAWGSFPWEEEIWPPFVPVAQRLTTPDVVARLRRGDRQIRRNNSWRAGSAAVSSPPWRMLLKARAWQAAQRDRIDRIPRRLRLEIAARRRA